MQFRTLPLFALLTATLLSLPASAQTVRFETSLGNIDVELLPDSAPLTVENFLMYLNKGAYTNTFIHRSVPGFIIQGGGYQFINNAIATIKSDPAVKNEFKLSNTRGTIAMAKLGTNPNSATNEWFFNLVNNASNLDSQNGGFTVFGRVSAGLSVMDKIAAVRVYTYKSFDQIPLQSYSSGAVTAANLVLITSIRVLDPKPAISQNGVISASSFGGLAAAATGSFLEIYGSNFSAATRGWSGEDFSEGRAPTSLEGVTVAVGGKPAFVNYVSPNQVNVQVPAGVVLGSAVSVVVSYGGQSSSTVRIPIKETAGGLLAPPNFLVGGKQYAAPFHATTGQLVSNGSVPDVPAAPAMPGETLTFYGTGFGPIAGGEVAGNIAVGETSLATTVEFIFGDIPAQSTYSGLAPGYVGLYQFNVKVPTAVPAGDVALTVLVGGSPIAQKLFVPIGN